MKDVRELLVVQIRLFPVDTIPLSILTSSTVRQVIAEQFNFQGVSSGSPLLGIPLSRGIQTLALQEGEYEWDGSLIIIRSLEIQPRRIILRISGTSMQADKIFEALMGLINDVIPERASDLSNVIYKAEETSCVAKLDFEFTQIFRPKVSNFLRKQLTQEASESQIPAKVRPSGFSAKVTYDVRDDTIRDHGITVNPKDFIIQPRENTPLGEKVYFTKSPFSSDLHFKLIEQFEQMFK